MHRILSCCDEKLQLRDLFEEMQLGGAAAQHTHGLTWSFGWQRFGAKEHATQRDPGEFLLTGAGNMLELLRRELHGSPQAGLVDMFTGSEVVETTCPRCVHDGLAVHLAPSQQHVPTNLITVNMFDEGRAQTSLEEALDSRCNTTTEPRRCDDCGEAGVKKTETTRFRRAHLPDVLAIEINRFQGWAAEKSGACFEFGLELDLTPHVVPAAAAAPPVMYDLSTVILHKGALRSAGHYACYRRDAYSGAWEFFDDLDNNTQGRHVDPAVVFGAGDPLSRTWCAFGDGDNQRGSARQLFYTRRPPGAPVRPMPPAGRLATARQQRRDVVEARRGELCASVYLTEAGATRVVSLRKLRGGQPLLRSSRLREVVVRPAQNARRCSAHS